MNLTVPLCVDLDGTLVRTDMLHEALLGAMRTAPWSLRSLPAWLRGGKAQLKHQVAKGFDFDPASLPYSDDVLDLIHSARNAGRPVVLVTAAPSKVARSIADNLGLFDEVISSTETLNLSGQRKAEALILRFGKQGFDYIGNHEHDLPVLAHARNGFLITSSKSLRRQASEVRPQLTLFEPPPRGARVWAKALRVHQWLKNSLILVPVLAANELANSEIVLNALVALVAFCLCASAIYIVNDLLDLPVDRIHRSKRRRAFASGDLSIQAGAAAAGLLLIVSGLLALLLPIEFLFVLGLYCFATTLYSFWLKRQVIVDVMVLAGLYTVRIVAGAAATGIRPSFWLLAFSMFVFFSLALVKRFSELRDVTHESPSGGRGYAASDLPVILALGSGSGLVSVMVLALYTQSGIVFGRAGTPEWLWVIPPLMLYWVARLWSKAGRGEIDDDPVVFAAKDWQSLVTVSLMALAFILSGSEWRPF